MSREIFCRKCDTLKPEGDFSPCGHRTSGFQAWCRGCHAMNISHRRASKLAARGPEFIVSEMLARARQRAQKNGVEFSISASDVTWVDKCPILGVVLRKKTGGRGPAPDSPSLDRIDNAKGYIPGNVWVVSHRANSIKNTMSVAELRAVLAAKELVTSQPGSGTVTNE